MTHPSNLGDYVDRRGDPERPLFIGVDADGAETVLSRAGFDALADACARGLLARGVQRGERIAILAANRPDYLALLMGAMRAGIVPVPVNYKFPPALVRHVIADSGARLVVGDAPRLAALAADVLPGVARLDFDADGPGGLRALLDPGPFTPVLPGPKEAAIFLYTSGSTGRPKGVMLSHAAHLWVARTRLEDVPDVAAERVLIAAPLYHMNALALAWLACAGGATAVLLPQFQALAYIDAISRYRCTWITAVPPMIAMLLREKAALATADLSSVRRVRMGSAPVSDSLALQIRALLPGAHVVNAYGTTEGGPIVFGPHPDGRPTPTASVGYPHPEVAVRLHGPLAPEQGVLQMRSPAVMLGYHQRPELRPPIDAEGWYDTGDVFRRDADGFYAFVGRSDDMFVSGGENIFPGEVEAVLETHPDVLQACVVPVDDEIKGTKPVAFVVRRPGATVDEDAIKRHALAHGTAYQHPRHVWFVDGLQLATTNKVDRHAMRQRAEEQLKSLPTR